MRRLLAETGEIHRMEHNVRAKKKTPSFHVGKRKIILVIYSKITDIQCALWLNKAMN